MAINAVVVTQAPVIARSSGAVYVMGTPYTGAYTVTPSAAEQVLYTDGLRMTDNITVNPIPSNYGLITWNGSVLTVS